MQRHQEILSVAVALAVWAGTANGAPPDPDDDMAEAPAPVTWQVVETRHHGSDTRGLAAVVFGAVRERGHSEPASLRVDYVDGQTTVRVNTAGLKPGPFAVAVKYSLDGGRFVAATWQPSADGSDLELSGDRAIAFLGELYGRSELRLAVVRPLSVPFVVTFAIDGTEQALRPLAERYHWSSGPAISDAGR